MSATARYNFVPLSSCVLPSPIEEETLINDEARKKAYISYVKKNGTYSGYIDLEIVTKTSCFIGWKEKEGKAYREFFSPVNGKPIIPGSSIRGMIKNIFKIVTSSAMRNTKSDADFNDKKLFYREVGGKSELAEDYKNELVRNVNSGSKRGSETKASAGYLAQKHDGSYWMFPVEYTPRYDQHRAQIYKKGKFIPDNNTGEADVFSGFFKNKKRYARFSTIHGITPFAVDKEAIDNYNEDTTRNKDFNLLTTMGISGDDAIRFIGSNEYKYVTACFYLPISKTQLHTVKSMGHNMFYRIQYNKSIGEHVPAAMKGDTVDFSDAIFGRKELWGSRVFFEDAESVGNVTYDREEYIKELLDPKPTSYQFYLEQKSNTKSPDNWNSNAKIRGYKMYWHQPNGEDWRADRRKSINNNTERTDDEMNKVTQRIKPVKNGTVFRGKIRFERLSKIELGALMMVFKLSIEDSDCCFKIGKGKAVGLGSIRVNSSLCLFNEKEGYTNIFGSTHLWNEAIYDADYNDFTNEFIKYRSSKFSATELSAYKKAQDELMELLDWSNTNSKDWMKNIAQMENGCREFKYRNILPKAYQVTGHR